MNQKILTLLGFAAKAGKLSYGFDAVKTALAQGKSKLVLIANDVSPKSKKEVLFYSEKYKAEATVLTGCDMQIISHAVGRKCGIISVNDKSFAEGLQLAINSREELK